MSVVCALLPVPARGRDRTAASPAGASRPAGFRRDLLFLLFSWRSHASRGQNSLSNLQLYSGVSFKLLPCAILLVCSSTVCVYLVRPRDSLLPRIIKQRKLTPFSVHFQPGGVKVFLSSGSLVDNFGSFLHGSLKHPAPTRTKPQLSTGTVNSTPLPPSLLPSLFSGPSTIWVPFLNSTACIEDLAQTLLLGETQLLKAMKTFFCFSGSFLLPYSSPELKLNTLFPLTKNSLKTWYLNIKYNFHKFYTALHTLGG